MKNLITLLVVMSVLGCSEYTHVNATQLDKGYAFCKSNGGVQAFKVEERKDTPLDTITAICKNRGTLVYKSETK